jgi:hypothetical protein
MLNFIISSLTVGIFKSARRTWFCYFCNISMFELLAVPRRGIPYVQMGFRNVLHISNLLSIDNSDFLPRIQYICWNFKPSFFLLANMRVCHVSLLSRWIPTYLAVSPCGICFPFSVTVGQFSLFKVKVTWVDLFSFAFIRQLFELNKMIWSSLDAVMGFWWGYNRCIIGIGCCHCLLGCCKYWVKYGSMDTALWYSRLDGVVFSVFFLVSDLKYPVSKVRFQ